MAKLTKYDLKELYKDYAERKQADETIIFNGLVNVLISAFKWENLPETIRPEFIELYLNLYGQCAICPNRNGDLIVALVNRGGAPDDYGLGTTPIISTLNGYTETYGEVINDVMFGDNGHRGVIIYNNEIKTANNFVAIFTNLLTEAVTSFLSNITHSRYNPVFVASTDIVKKAIENAMTDIIAGKPVVIVADNILNEIEGGARTFETVPLTDVDKQEKIQFISKTIDDLLRWFLSFYGQAVQGNGKLAQQTVDEVNGSTSASFILPENAYRCRQKAIGLINKTFGLNASISYNKPWAVELEKYTEDVENVENEENSTSSDDDSNNDESEEQKNDEI